MKRLFFNILLLVSLAANWYLYTLLQSESPLPSEENSKPAFANRPGMDFPKAGKAPTTQATKTNAFINDSNPAQGSSEITATNWLQRAEQYFSQRDFDRAINSLFEVQRESELDAQQLLLSWQKQVVDWIRGGNIAYADKFLTSFLHEQPYNIQILQIEALRLTFMGHYFEAIAVYRTIIDNSYDPEMRNRMLAKIHKLVDSQHLEFKKNSQWQALVDFIEQMTYDEPEHLPYQFILAQALLHLDRLEDAKMYLYALEQYDDYRLKAEQLLEQIDKRELGQGSISLARRGAHFLVPGDLIPAGKVSLILDTGATLSVLSARSFYRLGGRQNARFVKRAIMNTAGGQASASIYRFDALDVGGYIVKDIEFAVMQLGELEGTDGLLGMNFLQRFVFQIDQDNNALILSYR